MNKPLRPTLRFIAILPTLKIKEEVETTNLVIWKVELDKPVNIISNFPTLKSLMNLTTFYVSAITEENDVKIAIEMKPGTCDYLITYRDEKWYLKNEWWKWI